MTTKQTKTRKPTGYIIYRGPSMLDGKPIVVVAIASSSNAKTGNLVQTYILPDNGQDPITNTKTLADSSICGDCKHRRGTGGACYVNLGQGPLAVWKAYEKGNYPHSLTLAMEACRGRQVRLGTYGDPMAVPADVWMGLISQAAGHTGYTHQWANETLLNSKYLYMTQYNPIRSLCMASVDSDDEASDARFENWRTFRVRTADDEWMGRDEFTCPASAEYEQTHGNKKTCSTCMACNGVGENDVRIKKANPVIVVHGSLAKRFKAVAA